MEGKKERRVAKRFGTISFVNPVAFSQRKVSPKNDIWSFGATMMAIGERGKGEEEREEDPAKGCEDLWAVFQRCKEEMLPAFELLKLLEKILGKRSHKNCREELKSMLKELKG
jgi:hypothetical protein